LKMPFVKMHACGNDFILMDEVKARLVKKQERRRFAKRACTRYTSIGADGVIFLSKTRGKDDEFAARFFMPDGSEAEMCGNGARCVAAYAVDIGMVSTGKQIGIVAMDRTIRVSVIWQRRNTFMVEALMGRPKLKPKEVPVEATGDSFIRRKILVPAVGEMEVTALSTGVPHAVIFVDDVEKADVEGLGRAIRYMREIFPQGTNVDFVEFNGVLRVRTYERGVEHETLSCGTGVTASVAAAYLAGRVKANRPMSVVTRGCLMTVRVTANGSEIETIVLRGPAEIAFRGEVNL